MAVLGPKGQQALRGAGRVGEILEAISGPTTGTIYKLDQNTLLPVEPLIDVVPAVTPNRQSLDVITQSTFTETWNVTRNPVERGFNATANSKKNLIVVTLQGLISAAPQLQVAGALNAAIGALNNAGGSIDPKAQAFGAVVPGFPAPRRDLIAIQLLRLLAENREPVMVVTPDFALPKCVFTRIARSNGPSVGDATELQLDFMETRIVKPGFADAVTDLDELLGSNADSVDAGSQPTTAIESPAGLSGGGLG